MRASEPKQGYTLGEYFLVMIGRHSASFVLFFNVSWYRRNQALCGI